MIYLQMFWSFFQIGLFSFGGGYAAVPLIQEQIVKQRQWMELEQFVDFVTISEMTPGPIALNCATFVGQQMGGSPGALVCTLGCIAPSLILGLFLSFLYMKYRKLTVMKNILAGLRPVTVAMIAAAGLSIFLLAVYPGQFRGIELALCILDLILLKKFRLSPVLIIFGTGIAGTLLYVLVG